jgi:hypothetical protein
VFAVEDSGAAATPASLLQLGERDRLGIVVNEPFGALGAAPKNGFFYVLDA